MKRMTAFILAIMLTAAPVFAGTIVIKPEFLPENAYDVPVTMPCNWNRNLTQVRVYGFYGENHEKDWLELVGLRRDDGNLIIKFPQDTMNGPSGESLSHIEVEFAQTQRRCEEGFGFTNPLTR